MRKRKILSILLSLALLVSLLPMAAFAGGDEGDSTTTSSGVELSKTATLEDDGTYTIKLEAYATGEVKTTTTTTEVGVPCDIVLVLDQSSTMKYDFAGNKTNIAEEDQRKTSLKNAVNTFITQVQQNASENGVDHRIAIVGFASGNSQQSATSWKNTELLSTEKPVNYATEGSNNTTSSITVEQYRDALVDCTNTERLTNAINSIDANGSTFGNYGLEMAKGILDNREQKTYTTPDNKTANRKKIVVFFTDGYPGRYTTAKDGFFEGNLRSEDNENFNQISIANATIEQAAELKKEGVAVYSIGIFENADPSTDYNFEIGKYTEDGSRDVTRYTTGKQASNAYMHFVSSDYDSSCISMTSSPRDSVVNNGYYLAASNATALSKVFETISSSIDNSTSSTTCTLNEDSILKDIISDQFALPEGFSEESNVTVQTADYQGNNNFGTPQTVHDANVSVEGKAISVSGFDYSSNYVVDASGDVQTSGKKLIVTIKGVLPTDAAVTGEAVYTNAKNSGIYADATATTPAAVFPQPQTILTKKAYVLDYAKPFTMNTSDWKQTSTTLYGSFAKADLNPQYGNLTNLTYTPNTTKWDGYDNFYAFGETNDRDITSVSANANGNLWSKVSVLPANNVYYEDDFISSTESGTVGIEYTGTWTTDGTTNGNTETANGDVQGWEDSLANDTTYSDGSAHVSSTSGATATFTFTGTGVDIYSRTNNTTGTIYVTVKNTTNGTTTTKRTTVDNKAKSGDYYQIPTYTFQGAYGTYEVTVRVTTGAASEGRYTYYLDGIRVYNPIQNLENDETVQNAYGADELNATFTEVRSLLNANSGVAFVDEDDDGKSVSMNYADAEVSQLAPEHEVYLAAGQSVVFNVKENSSNSYYLGLKAPAGETGVAFSKDATTAAASINHASDLYYKVTPTNGSIVVKNTGENLLSITKLRTTGSGESGISDEITASEAVEAVMTLNASRSVAYSAEPVTEEELAAQETPTATESEESVVEETGEVIIENPEVPENKPEENSTVSHKQVQKLFNGAKKGMFGR